MDLGAFCQIDDLDQIAKKNGIDIPRLRGYRLMKDEKPFSQEEIKEMKQKCAVDIVEDLCCSEPFWSSNPMWFVYDIHTDRVKDYFLVKCKDDDGYEDYVDIRWDRIHGKKRKILKFAIKKKERKIQAQYGMWNKYAGQEGILYIHSRMGGNNWEAYGQKDSIIKQSWFLDRVDDCWDSTYCDFYARIK